MNIFFNDGINLRDVSSEWLSDYFKDFVRVDCPHRLDCRYADLQKKKRCVGYLFDYRHQNGASMVAIKCAKAKKVVMVRIDNHHHSFLEPGAPELLDFENQHEKIRCPNCEQRLFDAVVETKLDLRFKCARDNQQLIVLLSAQLDSEPEVKTQN